MYFKDYLIELAKYASINDELAQKLSGRFASPESGIQSIREVLGGSYDLPTLDELDTEGDEFIIELTTGNLYIVYYLTDDDDYEFYAEMGDESRMDELVDEEYEEE